MHLAQKVTMIYVVSKLHCLQSCRFNLSWVIVRLEPILIELEREQEDLLIVGHASVIRCLLAYLIGLPASEIPAIEVARGDLLEVRPASYGVHSQAYHFWDGPGRRGSSSSAAGTAKALGLGISEVNAAKQRPGSSSSKEKQRSKLRAGSTDDADPKSREEWYPTGDGHYTDEIDQGSGGASGVFGPAVVSDGEESDQDGDATGVVLNLEAVVGELKADDDGHSSDESTNFYENYAEDTKGKRKVKVEQHPDI